MLTTDVELRDSDFYELIGHERRRIALRCLLDNGGSLTLPELAEAVAIHETAETPPPESTRNSISTALHQVHLPELESLGVVRYEPESGEITLEERAFDASVRVVARNDLSWGEYYLLIAVLGLATVALAAVGTPLVAAVDPAVWVTSYAAIFTVSAVVHLHARGRRLLGRGRHLLGRVGL